MRISYAHPKIEPAELYALLRRHSLLPNTHDDSVLWTVKLLSERAVYSLITEEGEDPEVLASTLVVKMEPGILGLTWIPEVKKLHTRRNELIDLGMELRKLWFDQGIRRVEARVPISRTQTIRALKTLGFRQETLDWGLRAAVDYGRGPEGLAVLGLLETDAPREKREDAEVVEVING